MSCVSTSNPSGCRAASPKARPSAPLRAERPECLLPLILPHEAFGKLHTPHTPKQGS